MPTVSDSSIGSILVKGGIAASGVMLLIALVIVAGAISCYTVNKRKQRNRVKGTLSKIGSLTFCCSKKFVSLFIHLLVS